jgi:hypothetical protein
MNNPQSMPEMRGARDRAAEVRRRWSPDERRRRIGLPPDTPWALLRTFFCSDRLGDGNHFQRDRRAWQPSRVVVPRSQ